MPLPGHLEAQATATNTALAALSRKVRLTCVMPTLQTAVVVADRVQVVQEVQWVAGGHAGWLLPGRPGAWPRPGTSASLGHVGSHVEAREWKRHQRGELVSLLTHLTEPLEVDDEDVRQRPQAQLHHALLEGFAVRALPGVALGQLARKPPGL